MFNEMLKSFRNNGGYSQTQIADYVGVTQSTYSKYESGELPIPDDVVRSSIDFFKSPRLAAQAQSEKGLGVINIPILNNINDNTVAVLDSLIEEATEMIVFASELKKLVRNKKSIVDLTNIEIETIHKCEEQIADLYPALTLHFITMNEQLGVNLKMVENQMINKLRMKKYLR